MSDYYITLKPVYSCPATEIPNALNFPDDWTLSWHQAKTLRALRDPNVDIVFNRLVAL